MDRGHHQRAVRPSSVPIMVPAGRSVTLVSVTRLEVGSGATMTLTFGDGASPTPNTLFQIDDMQADAIGRPIELNLRLDNGMAFYSPDNSARIEVVYEVD